MNLVQVWQQNIWMVTENQKKLSKLEKAFQKLFNWKKALRKSVACHPSSLMVQLLDCTLCESFVLGTCEELQLIDPWHPGGFDFWQNLLIVQCSCLPRSYFKTKSRFYNYIKIKFEPVGVAHCSNVFFRG